MDETTENQNQTEAEISEQKAQIDPSQIDKLEAKSQSLLKNQKYIESLKIIIDVIAQKETLFGSESQTFISYLNEIAKIFNQYAMQLLNQEKFIISQKIFKHLIKVLRNYATAPQTLSMLNLTYNNLSCCYKRLGKIKDAQRCLEKALKIQQDCENFNEQISIVEQNQSLTELNLCAIYSQLNDHVKGKEYALMAVLKLQKEIQTLKDEMNEDIEEKRAEFAQVYNEKVSLLAIANYNLGSQHEFLNEFQDAINHYEHAVQLIYDNQDYNNHLLVEFKNSIKQAKARHLAYIMKSDGRTFTNLSKNKLQINEQPSNASFVAASPFNQYNQTNLVYKDPTSHQQRKIRPLSAQVKNASNQINQRSHQQLDPLNTNQPPQFIEDQNQYQRIEVGRVAKRIRPTSSYVRDKNTKQFNLIQNSITHLRGSHQENTTNMDESFEKRPSYKQSEFQQISSIFNSNQKINQINTYQNQLEDDVEEIPDDDTQDNEYDDMPHPLMLQRRPQNTKQISRPISAKTNNSYSQQRRSISSVQRQNQSKQRQSNNQIYADEDNQTLYRPRQKSIEKAYQGSEQQIIELKNQYNYGTSLGKPPKKSNSQMKFNKQTKTRPSSAFHQQNQLTSPQNRPSQLTLQSQAFLNKSGIQDSDHLFSMIDKNFNKLPGANSTTKSSHSTLGSLYAKEARIQQEIFYYNNEIMNKVVNDLQSQEKPNIPRAPVPVHYHSSGSAPKFKSGNTLKKRVKNLMNEQQTIDHLKSSSQRRNTHQVSQKQIMQSQSTNSYQNLVKQHTYHAQGPDSDVQNESYNEIQPIMNQINDYTSQESRKEQKNFNIRKSSRNKLRDSFMLIDNNHTNIQSYQSLPAHGQPKKLRQYNPQILEGFVIKLQRVFRGWLARRHFQLTKSQQYRQRILYQTSYRSNHYGLCNLYLQAKGRQYDIVLKSVQTKCKVLQRQIHKGDVWANKYQKSQLEEQQMIEKFKELLKSATGDIYKDFFDFGNPQMSPKRPSTAQAETKKTANFNQQVTESFNSMRSIVKSFNSSMGNAKNTGQSNRSSVIQRVQTQNEMLGKSQTFAPPCIDINESLISAIPQNQNNQSEIFSRDSQRSQKQQEILLEKKKSFTQLLVKIQALARCFLVRRRFLYLQNKLSKNILIRFTKNFIIDQNTKKYAHLEVFVNTFDDDLIIVRGRDIQGISKTFIHEFITGVSKTNVNNVKEFLDYLQQSLIMKRSKKYKCEQEEHFELLIPFFKRDVQQYLISKDENRDHQNSNYISKINQSEALQSKQSKSQQSQYQLATSQLQMFDKSLLNQTLKNEELQKSSFVNLNNTQTASQGRLNPGMQLATPKKKNDQQILFTQEKKGSTSNLSHSLSRSLHERIKSMNHSASKKGIFSEQNSFRQFNETSNYIQKSPQQKSSSKKQIQRDKIKIVSNKKNNLKSVSSTHKPSRYSHQDMKIQKEKQNQSLKDHEIERPNFLDLVIRIQLWYRRKVGLRNLKFRIDQRKRLEQRIDQSMGSQGLDKSSLREDQNSINKSQVEEIEQRAANLSKIMQQDLKPYLTQKILRAVIVIQRAFRRFKYGRIDDIAKNVQNLKLIIHKGILMIGDHYYNFTVKPYQDKTFEIVFINFKTKKQTIAYHEVKGETNLEKLEKSEKFYFQKLLKSKNISIKETGEFVINEIQQNEDKELVTQVLRIQTLFRNRAKRNKLRKLEAEQQKNQEKEQPKQEEVKKPAKSKLVNKAKQILMLQKFKISPKQQLEQEKELILVYQVENEENQKVEISLFINNSKNLIILNSESIETLSIYMQDFMAKYKPSSLNLTEKEDSLNYIKETIPKITKIEKNTITLIEPQKNETELSQQPETFKTLTREELQELVATTTTNNDMVETCKFDSIPIQNVMKEEKIDKLHLENQLDQSLKIIIFRDMINNLFIKVAFEGSELTFVERINLEKLEKISHTVINNNIVKASETLVQEISFRISHLNSQLEEGQTIKNDDIQNLIKAYGFEEQSLEQNLPKIQDIVQQTKRIQNVFRMKKTLKLKERLEEVKVEDQDPPMLSVKSTVSHPSELNKTQPLPFGPKSQKSENQLNNGISRQSNFLTIKEQTFQENSQFKIQWSKQTSNAYSEQQVSKRSLSSLKTFNRSGKIMLMKQRSYISGQHCQIEIKIDYSLGCFLVFVRPKTFSIGQEPLLMELFDEEIQTKTLQQLTDEAKEILDKIELIDNNYLELRATNMIDSSILSSDVLLKQGIELQNRFFIVTIADNDIYLIIDAFEEKTQRRLELRLKRQNRGVAPSEKELRRILERLDIIKMQMGDTQRDKGNQEEILVIKSV